MADFFPAFLTEWQGIINTVWPEIILPGGGAASNLFTAIQSLKKNIVVKANEADPALPYAFIAIGNFPASNVTSDMNDKNGPVTIFYLDSEKNGATQISINAKLYALDAYVRTHTFNTFRQLSDANIDSSDLNPVMNQLRTVAGVTICGGIITFPNLYVRALS